MKKYLIKQHKTMNRTVFSQSLELYFKQRLSPLSPGQLDENGTPQLCAAAMLAYAGLLNEYGLQKADEFSKIVCVAQDSNLIFETFDKLGWDKKLCSDALVTNDTRHTLYRKDEVINYFKSKLDFS